MRAHARVPMSCLICAVVLATAASGLALFAAAAGSSGPGSTAQKPAGATAAAVAEVAPPAGMPLSERIDASDFVGIIHIDAIKPSRDSGLPNDKRRDWFVETADATVLETLKGAHIPSTITINFNNGHGEPRPSYDQDANYLVFLSHEPGGAFATVNLEHGCFKVEGSMIQNWEGATPPVAIGEAKSDIAKLLVK